MDDLKIIRNKLGAIFKNSSIYINEYVVGQGSPANKAVSYDEYLDITGKSEMIVDIYRVDPDEGFSFHIPEALLLQRKVIINRLMISKCDFYDPSRFFIIGYDSIDRLEEFVNCVYKAIGSEIMNRYDCCNWWK